MGMKRHFLGWHRPFPTLFGERLKGEIPRSGDMDGLLVWLPSSRACRHVLSELFSGPADETEAFHPPRLTTPAQFEESILGGDGVASEAQELLVWKTVLQDASPGHLHPVFPALPQHRSNEWAYTLAEHLLRVHRRLASENMDFASVSRQGLPGEAERWRALAELEKSYRARLAALGVGESGSRMGERLSGLLATWQPARVLVAGVMNLSRRQVELLERLAGHGITVEIFLPVPEECADEFDEWGRPIEARWRGREVPQALVSGKILRSGDPREIASSILQLAEQYHLGVDALVVGSPDAEVGRYIVERSRLTDTSFYTPEGSPLAETSWGRLLKRLRMIRGGASFSDLLELLSHSLFRQWLVGEGVDTCACEKALLCLMRERLIHHTSQLSDTALKPLSEAGIVRDLMSSVLNLTGRGAQSGSFPEWIWAALQAVAARVDLLPEEIAILGSMEEILQDLHSCLEGVNVTDEDGWALLDHLLRKNHHYPERAPDERPVSGWLELPWERAPHLVIAGLPDSKVPGPNVSDTFLSPSLCRHLGIRGMEQEEAFHACRLRLILESRRDWGRLDILLPDRGLDDDPEMPSRHLFPASDDDILDRMEMLMAEQPASEATVAAEFGTTLVLPEPPAVERLRVTDFSAYLRCPLHYLFERRYGWSVPRELPVELEPMGFGTLAHLVLEQLNGTEEGSGLIREPDIVAFLQDMLTGIIQREYGQQLSVPVQIQASGMRERLAAAARIISLERESGWRPVQTEWKFAGSIDFQIGGIPVSGMIDLVERNELTGLYRVVDYKTSDSPVEAEKAHLSSPNARSGDPLFPECDFTENDKPRRWKDLQLMIYQMAVAQAMDTEPVLAYFNLAKAVSQIAISPWQPTTVQVRAARLCAEAVVHRILENRFPLGSGPVYRDDWLDWFGGDYTTGIHPDSKNRFMEAQA